HSLSSRMDGFASFSGTPCPTNHWNKSCKGESGMFQAICIRHFFTCRGVDSIDRSSGVIVPRQFPNKGTTVFPCFFIPSHIFDTLSFGTHFAGFLLFILVV